MKVVVPLAEGFEEIEAVTIIDVLRRAGIDVTTVFIDKNPVMGAHQIEFKADRNIDEIKNSDFDAVSLPGGMPGSRNLKEDDRVISLIRDVYDKGGYASAICAAPMVLSHAGVLDKRKVTCYPGFEDKSESTQYISDPVVVDERIITGKGAGCAIPFALKLVEIFSGKELSDDLGNKMQVYWM